MAQLRGAVVITGEWECIECGYVTEGTETRPPRKCPECNAPGNAFEFFEYDDDDDSDWDDPSDEEEDEEEDD